MIKYKRVSASDNISYENEVLIVSEADCHGVAKIYFKVHSAVQIYDLENGVWFFYIEEVTD